MLTWPQSSLKGLPIIIAWPLATLTPQKEFCPVSKKQHVPCTKNIRTCLCHQTGNTRLAQATQQSIRGGSWELIRLLFHHKVPKPNRNCIDFFPASSATPSTFARQRLKCSTCTFSLAGMIQQHLYSHFTCWGKSGTFTVSHRPEAIMTAVILKVSKKSQKLMEDSPI